jgi:uncharacterized protein (DUF2235 family)
VRTVRHALALNEQRSWFIPTSWGGIDGEDREKLGVTPDAGYEDQDVQEVWFRGCHSDVGGGDAEAATALAPLAWMVREAKLCGLKTDAAAERAILEQGSGNATEIHESLKCGWLASEYLPRWELDNSTRPPKRYFKLGRTGKRHISQFSRGGKVYVHESARADCPLQGADTVR